MITVNKNSILMGLAVLAVIVTAVLVVVRLSGTPMFSFLNFSNPSHEVVAQKAVDYLNNSGLLEGQTATLTGFSEESGMIKISLQIGEEFFDSYATKDGKLFFPQAFPLEDI